MDTEEIVQTDLVLQNRLQEAALRWGPLYEKAEVDRRVARSIPPMPFREREARWEWAIRYQGVIPVEALQKYREAKDAKVFDEFHVVEAKYAERPQSVDPWLIGRVSDRYAVIARWD